MLKDEKDADKTVHKGATRKTIGIRFSLFQFFLLLAGGLCLLSFTQITILLVGKLIF